MFPVQLLWVHPISTTSLPLLCRLPQWTTIRQTIPTTQHPPQPPWINFLWNRSSPAHLRPSMSRLLPPFLPRLPTRRLHAWPSKILTRMLILRLPTQMCLRDRPVWVRPRSIGQASHCTQACLLQQARRHPHMPASTTTPIHRACRHRLPLATYPKSMSSDRSPVLDTPAAMTCTICTALVKHQTWTTSASAPHPHWSVSLKRSSSHQMISNRSTSMTSSSRLMSPPLRSSISCKPVWEPNPSRSLRRTCLTSRPHRIRYPFGRPISSMTLLHPWTRAIFVSPGRRSRAVSSCCLASACLSLSQFFLLFARGSPPFGDTLPPPQHRLYDLDER